MWHIAAFGGVAVNQRLNYDQLQIITRQSLSKPNNHKIK